MVLDNRQVHYFENDELHYNKEQSRSYIIGNHKIQFIALGYKHNIMVTMRGAIFGFGWNYDHQLGVVDPNSLLGVTNSMPIEVFTAIMKFKEADRLFDGSVIT